MKAKLADQASRTREQLSYARTKLVSAIQRRRQLGAPRLITGMERRWLDPNRGVFKLLERNADLLMSRFLYPYLFGLWNPYSRLLAKRFSLAEISISPPRWPPRLPSLKVLLLSDI